MKHINCNNAKEKPELNLMTIGALPPEILIDILSRLPVNSICCMRCVSKALLKMVDDLSFATLHMRRYFLPTGSTPCLPLFGRVGRLKEFLVLLLLSAGHATTKP
ncbi:unnamed protein product [Prunus armeniaca]|uniref:F-box domain-containing protein n=1 Tax=Prunus armeniaca TaxID=36596 RepID=A0A6J5WCR3_PRUAR|nr:unnamed protein product [Prunus armeniaca]